MSIPNKYVNNNLTPGQIYVGSKKLAAWLDRAKRMNIISTKVDTLPDSDKDDMAHDYRAVKAGEVDLSDPRGGQ